MRILKITTISLIVSTLATILLGFLSFVGEGYFKDKIGTYPEMTKKFLEYKNFCGRLGMISGVLLCITITLFILFVILMILKHTRKN